MASNYIDLPAYGDAHWKAPVQLTIDLPAFGNTIGDVRVTLDTDDIYIWNGTSWVLVASPASAQGITALIGDVTAMGPGVAVATVQFVGGQSASNVATATTLVNSPESGNVFLASPANGSSAPPAFRKIVAADLPAGTGTVTSVAFADGSTTPIYSISGSPITTSGTITETLNTQIANTVFAGPSSGPDAQPTFRALTSSDIPFPISGFTPGSVIFAGATGALSQDNPNFFWNDTNFSLGISINTPASNTFIDAVNVSGATKRIQLTGYGNNVGYRGRYANGTIGSPTAAVNSNVLNFISAQGYGLTGFPTTSTALMNMTATGTFTDTSMPTSINFSVTPVNSITAVQAMEIAPTGNILIGTATDSGIARLQSLVTTGSQLQLLYDTNNYSIFKSSSINEFTLNLAQNPTGSTGNINLTPAMGSAAGGNGGKAIINGGAASAVAGSQGGMIGLFAGAGTSTGSGGNGGDLTLNAGNANGDNTVNRPGGNIALNSGNSFGSTDGGTLIGHAGDGGAGTATAGSNGGNTNFFGGNGGIGSATSGIGGQINLTSGRGGAGTIGGNGGAASLIAGTGGTGSSSGGNGALVSVKGGPAASNAGSSGGGATISAGAGSTTGSGGAGGQVNINGGNAGGDNTVNRNGGDIDLNAGNSKGSSVGGQIALAAGNGGLGTATTGGNGGPIMVSPGNGGAGSATGGNGGDLTLEGGLGGASTANGNGGNVIFRTASTTSLARVGTVTNTGLWGFGNNASPTYLVDILGGNLGIGTAGDGIRVKEGSNAKQGTTALVAGSKVVANTAVTANSRIFLTSQVDGGTPGFIRVSTRTAGTSFTITSSSGTDTSTIAYEIFEPY